MTIEALVQAASSGDTETMDVLLAEKPELLNASLPSGMSPLTAALYYGKRNAVEWLLDRGVSVTIHEAAALGDDETLNYMLNLEPRLLTQISFDGWTPLHLAAFFGGFEAAKLLIERGADVNVRSTNAMANMPIHAAAAGSRTGIVQLLLERGADPNAQQSGGWTPLHQAADRCDVEMVKLLLRFGADASIGQDDGKTARAIAEEKGYTEVLDVLPA
ncbi:ankyrin repeat domain-containing protein [Paenibacillus sp.]|uniref:ankyrin repeat domain-containing protein n=1 Tax=Paenibacillus sp. TaxID=58172 RepID=UPI002D430C10|nr:ankyrin repeat domain-containing protein [Paenibacillus sp.]HZG85489.1 ankyrin repeat domain-containing protein [Paenibacillus sp.]